MIQNSAVAISAWNSTICYSHPWNELGTV